MDETERLQAARDWAHSIQVRFAEELSAEIARYAESDDGREGPYRDTIEQLFIDAGIDAGHDKIISVNASAKQSEFDEPRVRDLAQSHGNDIALSRIAAKIEEAELDPDQATLLDKLLGKDYEVITADERLDKIAADFVEHCATRWETGKSLFVCIDKITCARMCQRIVPHWRAKTAEVRAELEAKNAQALATADEAACAALNDEIDSLEKKAMWLDETTVEIIISEAAFILMKSSLSCRRRPSRPEEKQLVANNVYAHFWPQAMTGGYATL